MGNNLHGAWPSGDWAHFPPICVSLVLYVILFLLLHCLDGASRRAMNCHCRMLWIICIPVKQSRTLGRSQPGLIIHLGNCSLEKVEIFFFRQRTTQNPQTPPKEHSREFKRLYSSLRNSSNMICFDSTSRRKCLKQGEFNHSRRQRWKWSERSGSHEFAIIYLPLIITRGEKELQNINLMKHRPWVQILRNC